MKKAHQIIQDLEFVSSRNEIDIERLDKFLEHEKVWSSPSDFEVRGRATEAMKRAVGEFLLNCYDDPFSGYTLTLSGPSGIGKTHLLKCVCSFWKTYIYGRPQNIGGRRTFADFQRLNWNRLCEAKPQENSAKLRSTLVAVDDIGNWAETPNMERLENNRLTDLLSARENKFTLLTTNWSIAEIADRSARFADRMEARGNSFLMVDSEAYRAK